MKPSSSLVGTVAEQFGIDVKALEREGTFNVPLWKDAPYYIDPRLLEQCDVPEFRGAADLVYQRFQPVLKAMRAPNPSKRIEGALTSQLQFPETPGLLLGTSKACTGGRGIGPFLAAQMYSTMREFVDAGMREDPAILGILMVVEEGFGPDRISDLIAYVIRDSIVRYSHRVFDDLKIPGDPVSGYPGVRLPRNPCNGRFILLVPTSILREIHVSDSIDDLFGANDELRDHFNRKIREVYERKPRDRKGLEKADYRRVLLASPERFEDIVDAFHDSGVEAYDFQNDPSGHQFMDLGLSLVQQWEAPRIPSGITKEEFYDLVMKILAEIARLCEDRGILRGRGRGSFDERTVQRIIAGMAVIACRRANIDFSSETNSGRGPVDFKFSHGDRLKVVVELKLASNKEIMHGYEVQLPEYLRAEAAQFSVFVVVDYNGNDSVREKLRRKREEGLREGTAPAELLFIDARAKEGASRYHPAARLGGVKLTAVQAALVNTLREASNLPADELVETAMGTTPGRTRAAIKRNLSTLVNRKLVSVTNSAEGLPIYSLESQLIDPPKGAKTMAKAGRSRENRRDGAQRSKEAEADSSEPDEVDGERGR